MTDPRIRASIRYPNDLTVPGMWHARLVRSPYARRPGHRHRQLPRPSRMWSSSPPRTWSRWAATAARSRTSTCWPESPATSATRSPPSPLPTRPPPVRRPTCSRSATKRSPRSSTNAAPSGPAPRWCTTPTPSPTATPPTSACGPWKGPTCATASGSARLGLPQGEPYTADPEPDDHAEGFDAAQVIVDETFHLPAVQHVAMEPHACIASWRDGRLEVTTGTQTPFNMRQDLARLFGLPDTDVRDRLPAHGRVVRRQDLRAHRGHRRRGRAAARPAGAAGPGP